MDCLNFNVVLLSLISTKLTTSEFSPLIDKITASNYQDYTFSYASIWVHALPIAQVYVLSHLAVAHEFLWVVSEICWQSNKVSW